MKKLFTLLFASCIGFYSHAQTILYSQTFNSGSASDWSMNTTDLGGTNDITGNQWLINNIYAAGLLGTTTANEPTGITGAPHSYYMHINCGPIWSADFGSNCNFLAGSTGDTYFTALNTPIVTTGHTGVYLSFWWLCDGDATSAGDIYYRTSAGGAWTQITTAVPAATFYGSSSWAKDSVHLAAFDNQAFLEFGFQFTDGLDGAGNDPAFGVDDIMVYTSATTITTPPVASFTEGSTTSCQDSCSLFTSTTTGTVDSVRWSATGGTIAGATSNSTDICFPTAGVFTVTLTAYNSAGSNSSSTVITINPTPHPVITQSGHTLSVTGAYTSYQWVNGVTPITGATNATYTYTASGTYIVVVDSAGCLGGNSITPVGITNVNNAAGNYWVSQMGSSAIIINSSRALTENLTVTMYDATGRSIVTENWPAGNSGKQLNTSFLPAGLYIIKLSNPETATVLKWMKQ